MAYTPSAAAAHGNIGMFAALIAWETQDAYFNSGIDATISVVHDAEVDYSETGGTQAQHLDRLRNTSDGVMDTVHTWRNQNYGDVVVLLVDDNDGGGLCGSASRVMATAALAFAVVHWECADGPRFTFGHEIAHLQGADHDQAHDCDSGGNNYICSPYQFAHGTIAPDEEFRTVMASACLSCPRVPFFSNPDVSINGIPTGTATWEDNARVLNTTRYTVSGFRRLQIAITGPQGVPDEPASYTWVASHVSNGPVNAYQWRVRYEDGFEQNLGTAQSQELFVGGCFQHENYLFDLIATATYGDEVGTDTHRVTCASR